MAFRISTLAIATLATVFTSCVSPEEHNRVLSANEALREQLADLTDYQGKLAAKNKQLEEAVMRLGENAADREWIRQQKARLDELLAQYNAAGPRELPEGVTLVNTSEGVAFRVAGNLLFDPGKADVTPAGQSTLVQLVPTLKAEGRRIRVDGHTDDQPIQRSGWKSNLELSANRALSVASFLIQNGVDPRIISIAGFGEWQPAEQGSTEEARRANRRVEIQVLDL